MLAAPAISVISRERTFAMDFDLPLQPTRGASQANRLALPSCVRRWPGSRQCLSHRCRSMSDSDAHCHNRDHSEDRFDLPRRRRRSRLKHTGSKDRCGASRTPPNPDGRGDRFHYPARGGIITATSALQLPAMFRHAGQGVCRLVPRLGDSRQLGLPSYPVRLEGNPRNLEVVAEALSEGDEALDRRRQCSGEQHH